MKTRIITALLLAPALVICLLYANFYLISGIAFIASLIGIYEFFSVSGLSKKFSLYFPAFLGALLITLSNLFFKEYHSIFLALWLFVSFVFLLVFNKKLNASDIALMFFSILYIPNLFSYIPLVLNLENGRLIIWFIFIGAYLTDSFAYFVGIFFGKHKLCPSISPKKTVEGALGGILGSCLGFLLAGALFNSFGLNFNLLSLALVGIIASVISQIGDLSASVIKRAFNVKDYGNLFPGHGGILDRFDSVMLAAPMMYYCILLAQFLKDSAMFATFFVV